MKVTPEAVSIGTRLQVIARRLGPQSAERISDKYRMWRVQSGDDIDAGEHDRYMHELLDFIEGMTVRP